MRVGMGYDVHRLTEGRKLILERRDSVKKGFSDIPMQTFLFMR